MAAAAEQPRLIPVDNDDLEAWRIRTEPTFRHLTALLFPKADPEAPIIQDTPARTPEERIRILKSIEDNLTRQRLNRELYRQLQLEI